MNRIYRTVWNYATQSLVVVSELAKSNKKASAGASVSEVNAVNSLSKGKLLAFSGVMSALLLATGQVVAATGTDGGPNPVGQQCFYHTASQSVVCGDATTQSDDTINSIPPKTAKSVVMGVGTKSTGESNVAIGQQASIIKFTPHSGSTSASNPHQPNITYQPTAAVSIGNLSQAAHDSAIAIGNKAQANSFRDIAIGAEAGNGSTNVGSNGNNILIGNKAGYQAKVSNLVAIGANAGDQMGETKAGTYEYPNHAYNNVAVGTNANSKAANNAAMGRGVAGAKNEGVGVGRTVAVGMDSLANNGNTTAIGYATSATGALSTAVGSNSVATGAGSFAGGFTANAGGATSIAIGQYANATLVGSTVKYDTTGQGSIAIGASTKTPTKYSIALGEAATSTLENAVAIGATSTTAVAATKVDTASVGPLTYTGFEGEQNVEAGDLVSVGSAGQERQVKHVAPGEISATSTDAINGSQLYATQKVLGTAAGTLVTNVLGGDAAVAPDGTFTMSNIGDTGENTIHDAIKRLGGNVNNVANLAAAAKTSVVSSDNTIAVTQSQDPTTKATTFDLSVQPLTFAADSGTTVARQPGSTVVVNGDNKNITTQTTPNGVKVALNNVIDVVGVKSDFVAINYGPTLNKDKLDMNNAPIVNMASAFPINPATGQPYTSISAVQQAIADNVLDPAVLKNAVNLGDLAQSTGDQIKIDINNNIFGTDEDGNPYVNPNGSITSAGRAALRTYNVDDRGTQERNGIFNAIKNMNEQGIKFFHTNDGVVRSVKEGHSDHDSAANAAYSTAIGYRAEVEKAATGALAIGNGAVAKSAGSVAIGELAEAGEAHVAAGTPESAYSVNAQAEDAVAAKATAATKVFSVGKAGAERQIQNVAAGVVSATSTDAVNGSQLYQTNKAVAANTKAIEKLRGDVHNMDRKLRAGIAGAVATAGLPQAYTPGKNMVAAAAGTYKGETAVALGVSRISDNGKVVLKLTGNANSRGDVGASIGAGYQW